MSNGLIEDFDAVVNKDNGFSFTMRRFVNFVKYHEAIPDYIPDSQIVKYLCATGWELEIEDGKLVPTKEGKIVFESTKKK